MIAEAHRNGMDVRWYKREALLESTKLLWVSIYILHTSCIGPSVSKIHRIDGHTAVPRRPAASGSMFPDYRRCLVNDIVRNWSFTPRGAGFVTAHGYQVQTAVVLTVLRTLTSSNKLRRYEEVGGQDRHGAPIQPRSRHTVMCLYAIMVTNAGRHL